MRDKWVVIFSSRTVKTVFVEAPHKMQALYNAKHGLYLLHEETAEMAYTPNVKTIDKWVQGVRQLGGYKT